MGDAPIRNHRRLDWVSILRLGGRSRSRSALSVSTRAFSFAVTIREPISAWLDNLALLRYFRPDECSRNHMMLFAEA